MSARTREMLGLIPVALIVSAGFGAVILARSEGGPPGAALDEVKAGTLTYGLVFLGLCLFAHLFMRARLPDADPYLFPLGATLAAFGLVVIYRIDPELAREQAQWFVIGLIVFVATIVFLRDHAVLERYRYTIAAAGHRAAADAARARAGRAGQRRVPERQARARSRSSPRSSPRSRSSSSWPATSGTPGTCWCARA